MLDTGSALIRCFIAAPLPSQVRSSIDAYLSELKRRSPDVKWVRTENIHLTLRFFGEIESKKVEEIKASLPALRSVLSPLRLNIQGSGCFPDKRRPRVFWLALGEQGRAELQQMYNRLQDHLVRIGFEREQRKFSPHLTLGRVKKNTDFRPLFEYMETHPFPAASFEVTSLQLIRSQLTPSGARYNPLAAVNF